MTSTRIDKCVQLSGWSLVERHIVNITECWFQPTALSTLRKCGFNPRHCQHCGIVVSTHGIVNIAEVWFQPTALSTLRKCGFNQRHCQHSCSVVSTNGTVNIPELWFQPTALLKLRKCVQSSTPSMCSFLEQDILSVLLQSAQLNNEWCIGTLL